MKASGFMTRKASVFTMLSVIPEPTDTRMVFWKVGPESAAMIPTVG